MKATCFEVKAPFGTFKDPRTTRGYFTFPFPPKTALIGLIGGVIGVQHNECYRPDHFLSKALVALQLLSRPRFLSCRSNQTQTNQVQNISGISIGFPKAKSDRGFIYPQTSTLVQNAAYRIFLHVDDEHRVEINKRLKNHEYHFPPFLGRANLLAELDYIGELELQLVEKKEKPIPVVSVFDLDSIKSIDGSYVVIPKMPNGYSVEEKEYKLDKEKHTTLQVRTSALVSMAFGKDESFRVINLALSEAGCRRAYRIEKFKEIPDLENMHVMVYP